MSLVSRISRIRRLLDSKKSRDAYVLEHIKRHIPFQVRTMREERTWSQAKAGQAIGKPQNVISRLESPAYGKLTLQTLLDIASGFDVGLLIKFVPFSRLVEEYEDLSPEALSAKSVSDKTEAEKLVAWAAQENTQALKGNLDTATLRLLPVIQSTQESSAIQRQLDFMRSRPTLVENKNNSLSLGYLSGIDQKRIQSKQESPDFPKQKEYNQSVAGVGI